MRDGLFYTENITIGAVPYTYNSSIFWSLSKMDMRTGTEASPLAIPDCINKFSEVPNSFCHPLRIHLGLLTSLPLYHS